MFAGVEALSKTKLRLFRTLQQKRGRRKHRMFLAEGWKLLNEALQAGWQPQAVVYNQELEAQVLSAPIPEAVPLYSLPPGQLSELTDQPNPEGVFTVLQLPPHRPVTGLRGPAMVLWQVQDPGNFGTLLRSAEWFGFSAIYCAPGTVDCYNPKVVRASMGALFHLPVYYPENLAELLASTTLPVYAAHMHGEAVAPGQLAPTGLLLLGNEANGLPPELLAYRTVKPVRIPGRGASDSLNVAVAGSILAYIMAGT